METMNMGAQDANAKKLIVVVDDDAGVRWSTKMILEHSEYEIKEAADGELAISLIASLSFSMD